MGIVNIFIHDVTKSLDLRSRESMIVNIPYDGSRRKRDFIGRGLSKGESDDPTRNMRNGANAELGRIRVRRFPDEND